MAVVAIDWDNTLVDSRQKLLPGAREAIARLRGANHKVIIHSCNKVDWIDKCLNEFGIPIDAIWSGPGKPLADLYIDDRGYRFPYSGDWGNEIDKVMNDDRLKDKDNRKW